MLFMYFDEYGDHIYFTLKTNMTGVKAKFGIAIMAAYNSGTIIRIYIINIHSHLIVTSDSQLVMMYYL